MTENYTKMSVAQVGEALGRDRSTVHRWRKAGCPANKDGSLQLSDVVDWLIDSAVAKEAQKYEAAVPDSPAIERFRLASAQLKELELARQRDMWLSREDVERKFAQRALYLKSDIANFIYSHATELISTCHGDQSYGPDVVQLWLDGVEAWIGRYSQTIHCDDGSEVNPNYQAAETTDGGA